MRRSAFPLALAWTLAAAGSGVAQAPWLGVERAPRFAAELMKPGFDNSSDVHPASSALFLSGRIRVTPGVMVVGELPVAFGGSRYDTGSDVQVGNAYVGVEAGPADGPVWVELGGRLPLVGSNASSAAEVGLFTDIDRFSAFSPEVAALSGALNYRVHSQSGTGVRVRIGPELWLRTSDQYSRRTEFLGSYGAQLYHVAGPLELSAQGTGVVNLSAEDAGSFGKRSIHQLGFGASYLFGTVRPGVVLRLPLDKDLREVLDYVVGLTVQIPLH